MAVCCVAARSPIGVERPLCLPYRGMCRRLRINNVGFPCGEDFYALTPLLLYHLPPKGVENRKWFYTSVRIYIACVKSDSPEGAQELVVITKTYDLILWSCHHTGKFPRNHRFVLGERIERNLYDLLEILIRAKYTRNRQELLEKANLVLEILRFQM